MRLTPWRAPERSAYLQWLAFGGWTGFALTTGARLCPRLPLERTRPRVRDAHWNRPNRRHRRGPFVLLRPR